MRYTKILLFLLVAAIQAFAAWTGGTSEPESTRKIGGKIFYEITTPEELAWFALQVNSGSTAINAVLANDIVFGRDTASLASVSWIPIGKDTSTAFEGVLDGRGFAIYGMKVQDSSTKATDTLNLGLFGVIARDGWVQNLSLQRASVYTNDSVSNVGLIAGYSRGNLRNISAAGSVTSAKGNYHGGSAGGIAGRVSGVMDSVSFMGDSVQSKRYVGGIVGYATDSLTISNSTNTGAVSNASGCSGGFVGYVSSNSTVTISSSQNSGNVSANPSSDSYSGGFVGCAYNRSTVTISNSSNEGAVSANSTSSYSYSGGFVGYASSNSTVTISSSTNAGAVTANSYHYSYSGGFVGNANGTVTISNSSNEGAVRANSTSYSSYSYSGGFVGYAYDRSTVTISNSSNTGAVSADYSGGFVGYAYDRSTVTISNSTNTGAVSNASGCSGGFVGYVSSNSTVTISSSQNSGNITGTVSTSSSKTNLYSYVGGFIGWSYKGQILDSYNTGSVRAKDTSAVSPNSSYRHLLYAGGLAGYLDSGMTIKNAYSATDSVSYSFITSNSYTVGYAGALVGLSKGSLQNVYFDSDSLSLAAIGSDSSASKINVGGFSTANMQRDLFAWQLNSTGGTEENSKIWSRNGGYPIFADAQNKAIYKVVFDDEGATTNRYSNNKGVIKFPEAPEPASGYVFVAWLDSSGNVFSEKSTLSCDKKVSAYYALETSPQYVVEFLDAEGDFWASLLANANGKLDSLPEPPAPDSGYYFMGWYDSLYSRIDTMTVFTENATLSAKYGELKDLSYTVVFLNADGDTLQSSSVKYGSVPEYTGATPTLAPTAEYSYSFKGWDSSLLPVTGPATYTATYNATINQYTISFVNYNDSILQSEVLPYGSAVTYKGTTPIRESTVAYNYVFKSFDKAVKSVTGTETYKALYDSSLVTYEVVFKNGTEVVNTQYVEYGKAATAPENPTRSGYIFIGWDKSFSKITAATVVNAMFSVAPKHQLIVYVDGQVIVEENPEEGTKYVLPEAPKKDGYEFVGWYSDGTFVGNAGDTITISKDISIEARYEAKVYTIAFKNGTTTLQSSEIAYGEMPKYSGSTPTKASTAKYAYTFAGWSPSIVSVTGEATYTAVFDSTLRSYTVAFKNGSTTLQSTAVAYGTTPKFNGNTPTKASTAKYTYMFAGWSPSVVSVTSEATYTAVFDSTLRSYTVAFKNGTTTLQSSEVTYGETPEYSGSTPTKAFTAKYAYTFAGWSPSVVSVTGAATYSAVFDSTLRSYTIAFKNGSTTLQSTAVAYGTTPKFNGSAPTKASSAKYEYTFAGWTPSIVSVTGAATYTAVFDSTLRSYTVAFKNGTTTLQSSEVAYGETPEYNGSAPTKASSAKYAYTFAGWSPSVVSVTGAATYSAVFDSTLRKYPITIDDGNSQTETEANYLFVLPDAPEKDGYEFVGWYNGDEKLGMPGDTITVEKSISISAKWEKSEAIFATSLPRFNLSVTGKALQLSGVQANTPVAVFDMQGRIVKRLMAPGSNFVLEIPHAGTYIVRVGSQVQKIRVK